MLRLLADENLAIAIVDGLQQRAPKLDVLRIQDVGMKSADDLTVLAWAAEAGRILVTHDRRTIPFYVRERMNAGECMPGVFIVPQSLPIGAAIEQILLLAECSYEDEWESVVLHLPL